MCVAFADNRVFVVENELRFLRMRSINDACADICKQSRSQSTVLERDNVQHV